MVFATGLKLNQTSLLMKQRKILSGLSWLSKIGALSSELKKVLGRVLSGETVRNHLRPLEIFCEQNDIFINWKKTKSKFGKSAHTNPKDKAYSLDQIRLSKGYESFVCAVYTRRPEQTSPNPSELTEGSSRRQAVDLDAILDFKAQDIPESSRSVILRASRFVEFLNAIYAHNRRN